jgi:predicted metal-binding protein
VSQRTTATFCPRRVQVNEAMEALQHYNEQLLLRLERVTPLLRKRATEVEVEAKNILLEKQLSEKQLELLQAGMLIETLQSP